MLSVLPWNITVVKSIENEAQKMITQKKIPEVLPIIFPKTVSLKTLSICPFFPFLYPVDYEKKFQKNWIPHFTLLCLMLLLSVGCPKKLQKKLLKIEKYYLKTQISVKLFDIFIYGGNRYW